MTAEFDRLLAFHLPRVHRAAAGLLPNREEAREVAQDALTKAWAARDRYDPSRPFYPWLYTIVRNACRDASARGRHRAHPGLRTEQVVATTPGALDQLSLKRQEVVLRSALQRVTPEHREILVMRHFEDLSYAEIGELLEVPQGTVMSRLYRARKALVAAMKKESP